MSPPINPKKPHTKRNKKGWIDLNKTRQALIALVLCALTGVISFAAIRNNQGPSHLSNSEGSFISGILGNLNPFAGNQVADASEVSLAREYLYSEAGLIAIEDAGATSAIPSDLAIWRPSSGQWWTKAGQHSQQVTVQWGIASDRPALGDYDGDGKTDFCVFRPAEGRWYLIKSSSSDAATAAVTFGQNGDVPAPADYDGDGRTDFAVWRPASGMWYVMRSSDQGLTQLPLGSNGDVPSPHDYDGDGKADITVWRSNTSTFYSINSSDGELQFKNLGVGGAPVSSDYDGDGRADFAVRSGASWKINLSSTGTTESVAWQNSADIAVQNDYDGDGRVDIATWRPSTGTWFIRQSSDGATRTENWGMQGDIPVPALFRR